MPEAKTGENCKIDKVKYKGYTLHLGKTEAKNIGGCVEFSFVFQTTSFNNKQQLEKKCKEKVENEVKSLYCPLPYNLTISVNNGGTSRFSVSCEYCLFPYNKTWKFVAKDEKLYIALYPNFEKIKPDTNFYLNLSNAITYYEIGKIDQTNYISKIHILSNYVNEILFNTTENCIAYYYTKDGFPTAYQLCKEYANGEKFSIKDYLCVVPGEKVPIKNLVLQKYSGICQLDNALSYIYDGVYTGLAAEPLVREIIFLPILAAFTKYIGDKYLKSYVGDNDLLKYASAFLIFTFVSLVLGKLFSSASPLIIFILGALFYYPMFVSVLEKSLFSESASNDEEVKFFLTTLLVSFVIYFVFLLLTGTDRFILPDVLYHLVLGYAVGTYFADILYKAFIASLILIGIGIAWGVVSITLLVLLLHPKTKYFISIILLVLIAILIGGVLHIPYLEIAYKLMFAYTSILLQAISALLSFIGQQFNAITASIFYVLIFIVMLIILLFSVPLFTEKMVLSYLASIILNDLAETFLGKEILEPMFFISVSALVGIILYYLLTLPSHVGGASAAVIYTLPQPVSDIVSWLLTGISSTISIPLAAMLLVSSLFLTIGVGVLLFVDIVTIIKTRSLESINAWEVLAKAFLVVFGLWLFSLSFAVIMSAAEPVGAVVGSVLNFFKQAKLTLPSIFAKS